MSVITKAKATRDDDLSRDPEVKRIMRAVRETDGGMATLEIALMETALIALDAKRGEIERVAKQRAGDREPKDVKKLYRAVAKMGLTDPERARRILKHLGGEDGEQDHPSGTSQDVHSGGGQSKARQSVGAAGVVGALGSESLAESVFGVLDNKKVQGAAASFLSESSVGRGIVAVADFFAQAGGKFQFAARAIAEFGPIAGIRVANAYFRYGGYDVPVTDGKTELGDKIPTGTKKQVREGLIDILRKRLPGSGAEDAGAEPPSEGFIIDKDGNGLAHGVGRGNDHFLPFNSRHLRALRKAEGGEYIRRRMFGGLTVEDLHVAMMMGADKVTVVSNGGVFSLDLTQRSKGLKLEHMQVLNRYQSILDDRRLDFDGYTSALDALMAEFPLHFGVDEGLTKPGGWAAKADRIKPKERLLDQIKGLFDVLGGRDDDEDMRATSSSPRGVGGKRTGETDRDALLRQVKANPAARASLLRQYIAAHGENNEFVRTQRRILANESGRSGGHVNESARVRTPSNSGENWGQVETRKWTDEAETKAKAVQPPDSGYINQKGMREIESLLKGSGLNTKKPDPRHVGRLKELATAAAVNPDFLADNGDVLRELQEIFPNV